MMNDDTVTETPVVDDFFKLTDPVDVWDEDSFAVALQTAEPLCNHEYRPDALSSDLLKSRKIVDRTFNNVSFAKTSVTDLTFADCQFAKCLFIGTMFVKVEFRRCSFTDCNFYESTFIEVNADPKQFRRAITDPRYANIAAWLYQQLVENYYREASREFKNEAEYYLARWKRKQRFGDAQRKKVRWNKYWIRHMGSWLYDVCLGYSYVAKRFLITASACLVVMMVVNRVLAAHVFDVTGGVSLLKTVYFTMTTMATLGADGFNPVADGGYALVVANVLIGLLVFTGVVTVILKKVVR